MADPKQNLFFPVGGLETDIDDKLLPGGKAVELQNYYLPKVGRAERRFGTSNLPALTAIWGLAEHKGSLVAVRDDSTGYNNLLDVLATPTSTPWPSANASGPAVACSLRDRVTVILNKLGQTRFNSAGSVTSGDIAYGGGYLFAAFLSAASNEYLHFVAVEPTTGHIVAKYLADFSSSGMTGGSPAAWKIAYVNGYAVLAYETMAGTVGFIAMQPSAGFAITGVGAGVVSLGGNYHGAQFDIRVKDSTTVSVVYPNASSNARCVDFVPSTLGITTWTPQSAAAADIPITASVAWMQDFHSSGKIALIAGVLSTATVAVHWDMPSSGATRQAASTYSQVVASVPYNVTGHTLTSLATGQFLVVWDNSIGQIGTTSSWIGQVTRNALGVLQTQLMYRGATLRSKTFTTGSFEYACISYASPTDGIHFIVPMVAEMIQTSTAPMAHFSVRQGRGGCFSGVAAGGGGYSIVTSYISRFDGGGNADAQGIQVATVTFGSNPNTTTGPAKEAIGSLFVPGGQLREFDGATYAEAQWPYPPEIVSVTPGTGGALASSTTYYYVAVYARMNAQGRMMRSQPSLPMAVTMGASNNSNAVVVRPCRLTSLPGAMIEFYRATRDDPEIFQKVGVTANTTTADTVSFTDLVSNTTAAAGEFLYTTDGVLPAQTPPGFLAIAVAGNRMFGISQDDPQTVWYTKPFTLDTGLQWNEDSLTFDVRDAEGPLRSLWGMDDKLALLKDRQSYAVGGQIGLDNQGNGANFTAQIVTPGVGCSNPNAVAEYRDGVMFSSTGQRAGIFAITRSLDTVYVGAPVQRYISLQIVGALFVSTLAQVRFYTSNGTTLVYDIVNSQWSINTGQAARCAAAWNGTAVYVNSSADRARIEVTDNTVYTEAGTPYQGIISFPQIQVNQIRGYERFGRVQPIGELLAAAQDLTIILRKDWNSASPLATVTETVTSSPINLELRYMAKLSAMQVVIVDASPTDRGLAINGISCEVSVKRGLKKSVAAMT